MLLLLLKIQIKYVKNNEIQTNKQFSYVGNYC